MASNWRDVRALRANLNESKIAEHTTRMRGEIRAALNDRDWSGANVDTTQAANITVVVSAPLPERVAHALFVEAEARDIEPSALIRELVEKGLNVGGAA
ncbi:hypothetical protein [Micromonospora sp. WMMD1274]|uniref:hypothetical protein n=1 Tax=Micromonospora sp. WMMD1274 TaxID=3404116 RepID=UPI003B93AD4B